MSGRAWTAGQLRAALAGLPDDAVVIVNAASIDGDFCEEQIITGAGYGQIDWGDGYGLEQGTVFGVDCEFPTSDEEAAYSPRRPDRPRRPGSKGKEPLA
jgi:Family of unknown function (DUF6225)